MTTTFSNEDDEGYLNLDDATNNLYTKISRYYAIQIEAIGPDEYAVIKEACNYPEDYETHIANLKDAMRPENETREHIKEFLQSFPEFCHPQYAEIIEYAIQIIETQPEKAKMAGLQALMQVNNDLKEQHGSDDGDIPEQSVSDIPEMIPFQIGPQLIEVPSHQDPLLVTLYSVCFLSFSSRMAQYSDVAGSCGSSSAF